MSVPRATYRLQLHRAFGFNEARAIVPYLHDLGISHVYLSPITTAVPGSLHGYDVVDPTHLNAELGGEQAYRALTRALSHHGMGQVIDIVPNHMGAATANRWWMDVLRHGEASPYARIYDIDWAASTAGAAPRVLLPILGDRLDTVLDHNKLTIEVDTNGQPWLRYYETTLPLADDTADADTIATLNAAPTSDAAHEVLRTIVDAQHYQLAQWRDAKPRVNYRRFFVIDQLIGVRAEDPVVFGATHPLALRLLNEHAVEGLRVDHIDGLAEPDAYLARLNSEARVGTAESDEGAPYVIVEKILARDESLPEQWQCAGTTGYDFMRDVNAAFLDPSREPAMTALYEQFTDEHQSFEDIAYACRRAVADGPLAGPLHAVTIALYDASGAAARNVSAAAFDEALRTLLASLEVYRTYHTRTATDPTARAVVEAARERAAARLDGSSAALALAAELLAQPTEATIDAVQRLQQLMPTIQAKGVEDRAAYQYPRLLSLSEVGTSPATFGEDLTQFHARNVERARTWPASMLATATHDHKRGEDVRARLHVLPELSAEFAQHLERWRPITAHVRGEHITPTDEYVLHQVLLGSWPTEPFEAIRDDFTTRVLDYLVKFVREAGQRSNWEAPDTAYEDDLRAYVAALLDPATSASFLEDRAPFQQRVTQLGVMQSLGQVVLRVTCPGVPDTYQGTELWDLSLVDPDNRRPVNYEVRARTLTNLAPTLQAPTEPAARALLNDWRSGAVKQYVLASLLRDCREHPAVYADGTYEPLEVRGARATNVIAYARHDESDVRIVVCTRFASRLTQELWAPTWDETTLVLPTWCRGTSQDLLTGRTFAGTAELSLSDALGVLPVAVLRSEPT